MSLPSAERSATVHEFLTREPHVAGSPRDRELAEWVREQWLGWGVDEVEIVEHEVLLPYPNEVSVSMTAPKTTALSLKEDPIEGDPATARHRRRHSSPRVFGVGRHHGALVYAGSGNPADYDWLAAQGIDMKGKIALVRYSVPYSYRGFKALTAQQRGAAGILIYSDPADDGYAKGRGVSGRAVGPESPHSARRHRLRLSWCLAIR